MTKAFKTAVLSALAFASINASAQNGVNSPYSRSGFGLMSDRSMGFNKGMGGIAQGYRDGQSINTANPAALSACDSLTALFDIGVSLQNGNFKMGDLQQNARNSSFDYFAFHFRAAKDFGIAISMLPVTNIGYNFTSQSENLEGTDAQSSYTFSGNGGLHQIQLGLGWKIAKPLSIGANISYLYGDYYQNMSDKLSDKSTSTNISTMSKTYMADISTYTLDLGAQYTQKLSDKNSMVLGFTYSLGHDVNNDANMVIASANTSGTSNSDTKTIKNAFQVPHSFAAGVTYYHSYKFLAGVDYELQKWSNVKFPDNNSNDTYQSTTGQFNDRMKVAAGLAWTPDIYSTSNFAKRITYKFGGFYSKSYANADGTKLADKPYEFGLSAGMTLPLANANSNHSTPKLNVSFQWVHSEIPYLNASNIQNNLTENYLKVCLGLTISDRWFYKWKIK